MIETRLWSTALACGHGSKHVKSPKFSQLLRSTSTYLHEDPFHLKTLLVHLLRFGGRFHPRTFWCTIWNTPNHARIDPQWSYQWIFDTDLVIYPRMDWSILANKDHLDCQKSLRSADEIFWNPSQYRQDRFSGAQRPRCTCIWVSWDRQTVEPFTERKSQQMGRFYIKEYGWWYPPWTHLEKTSRGDGKSEALLTVARLSIKMLAL